MNNDMIEVAKDLIKKGEELNDSDLVKMGQEMLVKYQQTQSAEPAEDESKAFEYVCSACGYEFDSEKKRKRCPDCKKHKLELVVSEPKEANEVSVVPLQSTTPKRVTAEDFTMQVVDKQARSRKRINPETGEEEGSYTKNEPIVPGNIVNSFDDTLQEHDNDRDFTKKIKFSVSPRTRPKAKVITKSCEDCGRKFSVNPIHSRQYKCDTCISRGGRRR